MAIRVADLQNVASHSRFVAEQWCALFQVGQRLVMRNCKPIRNQPDGVFRRGSFSGPGVDGNVVVVSTRCQESGGVSNACHNFQAQKVVKEGLSFLQVGDVQIEVTDVRWGGAFAGIDSPLVVASKLPTSSGCVTI